MKLTSIFLDTTGLSQSEANHTANIAKEIAEGIGAEVSGMTLFKKVLHDTFGKTPYNFIKKVEDLKKKCLEEGGIYALSAWLREGIKAKALIIASIQNADVFDLGAEVVDQPKLVDLADLPVESDMIERLSIPERSEYLTCEAKAAHIGKKIHPRGLVSNWRKSLADTPPVSFVQAEKSHMRIDAERIIEPEEVDDLFFALQKEHRDAESRVNYYKAKLHNMFNAEMVKIQGANAALTETYNTEIAAWRGAYEVSSKKAEAKRAELMKEASELKIIIPADLQKTLDYVQTFSKK